MVHTILTSVNPVSSFSGYHLSPLRSNSRNEIVTGGCVKVRVKTTQEDLNDRRTIILELPAADSIYFTLIYYDNIYLYIIPNTGISKKWNVS